MDSLRQSVAYGVQDSYLTDNPKIIFFKTVYTRHTNFIMKFIQESIKDEEDEMIVNVQEPIEEDEEDELVVNN